MDIYEVKKELEELRGMRKRAEKAYNMLLDFYKTYTNFYKTYTKQGENLEYVKVEIKLVGSILGYEHIKIKKDLGDYQNERE